MSVNFDTVLKAELDQIRLRRNATLTSSDGAEPAGPSAPSPPPADGTTPPPASKEALGQQITDVYGALETALDMNLFGLAFSGGGIRSATFNLGVLQRLARHKLLSHVDYLSTVSGGGYIGSWLTAWVAREGNCDSGTPGAGLRNVETQLPPNRVAQANAEREGLPRGRPVPQEPEPVFHLREYSNYLSPKVGFFSADSWTLIAIYLRNLLLNQIILIGWSILATLAIRLIIWFFHARGESWLFLPLGLAACLLSRAFYRIGREMMLLADPRKSHPGVSESVLHGVIMAPLLASAILLTWLFTNATQGEPWAWTRQTAGLRLSGFALSFTDVVTVRSGDVPWRAAIYPVVLFGLLHGISHLLAYALHVRVEHLRANWHRVIAMTFAAFGSGAVGGFVFFIVLTCVLWPCIGWAGSSALFATIGPPLMFASFLAGAFAEVGLLGRALTEAEREWWSRLCAWCLVYSVVWVTVLGLSTFGLAGLAWTLDAFHEHRDKIITGATLSWLATTIAGALAGKASATRDGRGNRGAELLGLVAPYVFIAGLVIFISWVVSELLDGTMRTDGFWEVFNTPDGVRFVCLAVIVAFTVGVLSMCIDVNIFALHSMYANRLVRCYLGASRKKSRWADFALGGYRGGAPTNSAEPLRHENPVTGLDAADDFPLRELTIGEARSDRQLPVYWGPYPLINTAMNLVAGTELAYQERKAESFVLSPLYCGCRVTGYQQLPEGADKNLTMGRAIGISGAAASPNMGYHSSPPLTALMSAFNVRLGWWLQNPAKNPWVAAGPRAGGWLLRELFGQTDETSNFLYLSDGGHFENLGIYELVRRRCRFILVCDAGADPLYQFEDLAGAIRKCRSDFGVRIELDIESLRPDPLTGFSRWHCAVGKIRYSDVHVADGDVDGIIVYVKASVTGEEDSDVLAFRQAHPDFPHQTTADQFFDESQFESYRALGEHVIARVLGERRNEIREAPLLQNYDRAAVVELFTRLSQDFMPIFSDASDRLAQSSKGYITLHERLRDNEKLRKFSQALYPNFAVGDAETIGDRLREVHFACQLMQVLENAWLQMKLDDFAEHPLNRGWMLLLDRWSGSQIVRDYWKEIKGEFSEGFRRFFDELCEQAREREDEDGE